MIFVFEVCEKDTCSYKVLNEFFKQVPEGDMEYVDFLNDMLTDEEIDVADNSDNTATSEIVKDEEPAPKRFKTTTLSDVEQLRVQITEKTTDKSTKWSVGLLKGTYLLRFLLRIGFFFCLKVKIDVINKFYVECIINMINKIQTSI